MNYYIASCVFTKQYPELSRKIQNYIRSRYPDFEIIRCCIPNWKVKFYEDNMPEEMKEEWKSLVHTRQFQSGDDVWVLCHNCSNIVEDMYPGVKAHSLWELIDNDEQFVFPDFGGITVTVQDCWRSRDRLDEQTAVRNLLTKMNMKFVETPHNHADTDFCGISLYRDNEARNFHFAPSHYQHGIEGLFLPHTEEEQIKIIKEYCSQYKTEMIVCYCHYCLEGLVAGGVNGKHIAHLLFE